MRNCPHFLSCCFKTERNAKLWPRCWEKLLKFLICNKENYCSSSTVFYAVLLRRIFRILLNIYDDPFNENSYRLKAVTLHKKWSFPLRISSVNVIKSVVFTNKPTEPNFSGQFLFWEKSLKIPQKWSFLADLYHCSFWFCKNWISGKIWVFFYSLKCSKPIRL